MPSSDSSRHDRAKESRAPGKTVLLVDDEELVLRMGTRLIGELGFTVLTANRGRIAVDMVGSNADISLVILDLNMPEMDGEVCFRELRAVRPDLRVLISTGCSEHDAAQRFPADDRPAGFIQKPYRVTVLRKVLAEAFEPAGADA